MHYTIVIMGDPLILRGLTAKKVVNYRYSRGIDHDLSDISLLLTLAFISGVRCVKSDSLYILAWS